ncbi:unnamed protein product [Lampetra fluviatilis]
MATWVAVAGCCRGRQGVGLLATSEELPAALARPPDRCPAQRCPGQRQRASQISEARTRPTEAENSEE